MLKEIGSEDLIGELIRSVLSLVAARFRPSSDQTQVSRHRVEGLTFIRMLVRCPACVCT